MYVVHEIKWDKAHYKWNDFRLDSVYQQYLLETYGITVEDARVIWGKVFTVEIVIVPQGGAGEEVGIGGKKKKKKPKRIKLIFIMDDLYVKQEKEVKDIIAPKIISDIENNLTEQLGTKITLKDVQIIKG
jgi:hypothetical protein